MRIGMITSAIAVAAAGYSMIPTAAVRVKNYFQSRRKCSEKIIYLTFDDGPDPRYTPQLLDLLKENDIHASFFSVASFAAENPELIQRMHREGHLVGLHSLEHKCPLFTGPAYTYDDMGRSLEIMKTLDTDIRYFRPPWGTVNLPLLQMISRHGLRPVLWSVMAEDWRGDITADEICRRLMRRVRSGSIICLHDGRGENEAPSRTIEALRKALPQWKQEGYAFLRVDEKDER